MQQCRKEAYGKNRIVQQAAELVAEYHPRDPLDLANLLGLWVVVRELPPGIDGLVADVYGVTMVLISSGLPRPEQNYIAAHELFHSLDEHPSEELVRQGFWGEFFETQADYFACGLMIQEPIRESESQFEYSRRTGVPLRLVRLWSRSGSPLLSPAGP